MPGPTDPRDPNPYGLPVHIPAHNATGVLCQGVDDPGGPEMVVCPATPVATCAACLASVPQWHHDPARDEEADFDRHHRSSDEHCMGCWCYGCGGRTDAPRIRPAHDERELVDPTSHRWCFE